MQRNKNGEPGQAELCDLQARPATTIRDESRGNLALSGGDSWPLKHSQLPTLCATPAKHSSLGERSTQTQKAEIGLQQRKLELRLDRTHEVLRS